MVGRLRRDRRRAGADLTRKAIEDGVAVLRAARLAILRTLGALHLDDDRLLLPRYIDTADHTDAEFRGWLSGVAALLPRRCHAETSGQFLEGPVVP